MSDGTIKGTVEQVSSKEGNKHPKYGRSWRVGIKVDGQWYNAFTKKPAEDLGLEDGVLVTFEYVESGDYMNFDPKSLEIAEQGEREPAQTKSKTTTAPKTNSATAGGSSGNTVGIKIGHAITNAVQLAIKTGDVSLKAIHGHACDIIALGLKLESQYSQIVAAASKRLAAPAPAQEQEQQEETPPPKAKAKPAAEKKAATTSKAPAKAPPKEPDPDPANNGGFEDDDIPF